MQALTEDSIGFMKDLIFIDNYGKEEFIDELMENNKIDLSTVTKEQFKSYLEMAQEPLVEGFIENTQRGMILRKAQAAQDALKKIERTTRFKTATPSQKAKYLKKKHQLEQQFAKLKEVDDNGTSFLSKVRRALSLFFATLYTLFYILGIPSSIISGITATALIGSSSGAIGAVAFVAIWIAAFSLGLWIVSKIFTVFVKPHATEEDGKILAKQIQSAAAVTKSKIDANIKRNENGPKK